jgi:hypothetical protein
MLTEFRPGPVRLGFALFTVQAFHRHRAAAAILPDVGHDAPKQESKQAA